jgi:hypothetical protein
VEIVDQPIRGGRDLPCIKGPCHGRDVRRARRPLVVPRASFQTVIPGRARHDLLRGRETFYVLLETFDAGQLRADRLLVGCARHRGAMSNRAGDRSSNRSAKPC